MDDYMRLQEDREAGVLTEKAYQQAVQQIEWGDSGDSKSAVVANKPRKKVKKKRKSLVLSERNRRNILRPVVKWLFDLELVRQRTPLFSANDELVCSKFLPRANRCIDLLLSNPTISSVPNRCELIESITEMVSNRRRNWRNSRKPPKTVGSKKKIPLNTIYETRTKLELYNTAGQLIVVPVPELWSVNAASTSGRATSGRAAPGRATGHATPARANPGHATPGRATGHATPGRANPGHATPGHTTPGLATPSHATSGRATLGRTTPGHANPARANPDHATPGRANPGHATPDHATPGRATPSHATSGRATPGRATPDHVAPAIPGRTTPGRTTTSTRPPPQQPQPLLRHDHQPNHHNGTLTGTAITSTRRPPQHVTTTTSTRTLSEQNKQEVCVDCKKKTTHGIGWLQGEIRCSSCWKAHSNVDESEDDEFDLFNEMDNNDKVCVNSADPINM